MVFYRFLELYYFSICVGSLILASVSFVPSRVSCEALQAKQDRRAQRVWNLMRNFCTFNKTSAILNILNGLILSMILEGYYQKNQVLSSRISPALVTNDPERNKVNVSWICERPHDSPLRKKS